MNKVFFVFLSLLWGSVAIAQTVSPLSSSGGSGTVTSVSVVSANGFAGSVANATTTPAITLTTTVTGVLYGNGTTISASKLALTQPATGSTLTIVDGKTLTASNSLTLTGTDSTTMTFPTTSATIARTDAGQTFTGTNVFGITQATSLALGGATIGSNALAVTGTSAFSDNVTVAISGTGKGFRAATSWGFFGAQGTRLRSDLYVGWVSSTDATNDTALDVNISRLAAGVLQIGTTAVNALGGVYATFYRTVGSTVASLPTCAAGLVGQRRHVTDALTPTFLTLIAGGGTVVAPVFCDGSQWVGG